MWVDYKSQYFYLHFWVFSGPCTEVQICLQTVLTIYVVINLVNVFILLASLLTMKT